MDLSLNETQSLAVKAAKGAGMSWGMAQEAGSAVRYLSKFGLPGADALVNLLHQYDRGNALSEILDCSGNNWHGATGSLCPCVVGAALCDQSHSFNGAPEITLQNVAQPLLLIPFVARLAKEKETVIGLAWAGGECVVSAEGVIIQGPKTKLLCENAESVTCFVTSTGVNEIHQQSRADVSQEIYSGLLAFAHRTYAPATEESRQKGAGAGVTDND